MDEVTTHATRMSYSRSRFVCAWCRASMSKSGTSDNDGIENFGICRPCLNEQLARCERAKKVPLKGRSRRHARRPRDSGQHPAPHLS